MKSKLLFILIFTIIPTKMVMSEEDPPIIFEGNIGLSICKEYCFEHNHIPSFEISAFIDRTNLILKELKYSSGIKDFLEKINYYNNIGPIFIYRVIPLEYEYLNIFSWGVERREGIKIDHLMIFISLGLGNSITKLQSNVSSISRYGPFLPLGFGMSYDVNKNISIGGKIRYDISHYFSGWLSSVSFSYRL